MRAWVLVKVLEVLSGRWSIEVNSKDSHRYSLRASALWITLDHQLLILDIMPLINNVEKNVLGQIRRQLSIRITADIQNYTPSCYIHFLKSMAASILRTKLNAVVLYYVHQFTFIWLKFLHEKYGRQFCSHE